METTRLIDWSAIIDRKNFHMDTFHGRSCVSPKVSISIIILLQSLCTQPGWPTFGSRHASTARFDRDYVVILLGHEPIPQKSPTRIILVGKF